MVALPEHDPLTEIEAIKPAANFETHLRFFEIVAAVGELALIEAKAQFGKLIDSLTRK